VSNFLFLELRMRGLDSLEEYCLRRTTKDAHKKTSANDLECEALDRLLTRGLIRESFEHVNGRIGRVARPTLRGLMMLRILDRMWQLDGVSRVGEW
jgi:hypothetical protein